MTRKHLLTLFPLLLALLLPGCDRESDAISMEPDGSSQVEHEIPTEREVNESERNQAEALIDQHEQAHKDFHSFVDAGVDVLASALDHRDASQAVEELDAVIDRFAELSERIRGLDPLTNQQVANLKADIGQDTSASLEKLMENAHQINEIDTLDVALSPSIQRLYKTILSIQSPTVEQRQADAPRQAQPALTGDNVIGLTFEANPIPSAFILIEDAAPTDPQLLVQQLQQVLPKTMVVKLLQAPNTQDVRLEVTNVRDLRALANKIPFGSLESIDERTRTITVDFDL